MAQRKFNSVQQYATGTGVGDLTLGGITSLMYMTLQDAGILDGDTTYVRIQHETIPGEWEVVLITFNAGVISRTFDANSSSATGGLIDFSAGNKWVSSGIAAGAVVTMNTDGIVTDPVAFQGDLNILAPTVSTNALLAITGGATSGYGVIELGGGAGAYMDWKKPGSNDYAGRIESGATFNIASAASVPLTLNAIGAASGIYFFTDGDQRLVIGDGGVAAYTPVFVTPPAGLTRAFQTTQTATGTIGGPTFLNYFEIASDDIDGDNPGGLDHFVFGYKFMHRAGGSTIRGGRETVSADFELTAATNSTNNNRNYVGGAFYSTAKASDGGSAPTYADSKGAMFGGFSVGILEAAAENMLGVCSWEFDVAMFAGSSAYSKSVAIFSNRSDDVEQGSVIDTMLWLFKQVPSSGSTPVWRTGILFDFPDDPAAFPFDNTSTVLKVGTGTIGVGIDLSACTVDQYAYRSPGFSVGGTGAIVAASATVGAVQLLSDANGAIALGGVNKTPYIDFNSYNGTANDYDARIMVTGGSAATDGAGTFTIYSAVNVFTGHITVSDAKVIGWASRSFLASPTDGRITLTNNATADFGLLQFGGTSSSFPALKRSGAGLQVRLADDSDYSSLEAGNLSAPVLGTSGNRSSTSWTTTGVAIRAAAATFTDTSGSGTIGVRAANSLGIATFASSSSVTLTNAATLYIDGPPAAGSNTTITSSWAIYAAAGGIYTPAASIAVGPTNAFVIASRARIASVADGRILFHNNAGTDFNRIEFGGTTSAHPSIKRSSALLHFRVADDSAFTGFVALSGQITGNISSSAWSTTGPALSVLASTYTDTSGSGTTATRVASSFGVPTFASSNSVTLTNAATLYIANAPAAGTNTTITNGWALWVDAGDVRLDGNLNLTDTNIVLGTTTGTKIGTSTSQKIGFWNATPVAQPAAPAADSASIIAALQGIGIFAP